MKKNKITEIQLFGCGSCENDLGRVFYGQEKGKRRFPAMVGLIHHEKYGWMLYDTGYSKRVFENGILSLLYQLLNKATVKQEDYITYKLFKKGIAKKEIKHIILSHAHPDHIGALPLFPEATIVSTKQVFRTMDHPKLFDLVFKNMKPSRKQKRFIPKEYAGSSFLLKYFGKVYDVIGDGSILGVPLDGHAKGQLGLYFPEHKLLLAADASWGTDLLEKVGDMKFFPRKIQNDYRAYQKTAKALVRLKKAHPEIKIVFSHQADYV